MSEVHDQRRTATRRPIRRPAGPPWHVAHVIGHLRTGGAERQLVNYLLAADRCGFRHTVLCLESPGELADTVREAGIDVVHLPVRTRGLVGSVRRYARWLVANDVAVLHAHMHHAALFSRLGALWAGVPVLMTTEHGKELWKGPVRLAADHLLSRFTARHLCVSEENVRLRRRRERVDAGKLMVVPNGVPIPDLAFRGSAGERIRREFGLQPGDPVVGSVGRFIEAKGYEHMVAAVALLKREQPRVRWLAVGDGELRQSVKATAEAAGVGDCVIWAGRRGDVNDLIAAMDVWVMSSIREGLPVALLEAMACGAPIVATRVGGIPEAARDGQEAVLVPSGDAAALATAIGSLLADRERAALLGRAARERAVTGYSIDAVARQIEAVYRTELRRVLGGASVGS